MFMDMVEVEKPYATRGFSEVAATAVKEHEMVVTLFADEAAQRTVAILASDRLRMREVEERLLSVVSDQELDGLSPLSDAQYVRFAVRASTGRGPGKEPTGCSIEEIGQRYSKLAEEHPAWESKTIGGADHYFGLQYFLF